MEITISDIPEEGLHLNGILPVEIFQLDPRDSIRSGGPAEYQVDIYAFDEVIAFSGSLRGPFLLQCGLCLDYFEYDANFPSWTAELDLEIGQSGFELEQIIREDFLLNLPSHPRCDREGGRKNCSKAQFLERKDGEAPLENSSQDNRAVWRALDDWK